MINIDSMDMPDYEIVTASASVLVTPEDKPWHRFQSDPPECHGKALKTTKRTFKTAGNSRIYLLAQCPKCGNVYFHESRPKMNEV